MPDEFDRIDAERAGRVRSMVAVVILVVFGSLYSLLSWLGALLP